MYGWQVGFMRRYHLGITFCPLGRAKCCQECGKSGAETREQISGYSTVSESSWTSRSFSGSATPGNPAEHSTDSLNPQEFGTQNTSPLLFRFTGF